MESDSHTLMLYGYDSDTAALSGIDVVIVNGVVDGPTTTGELLGWQSAGWAGRGGFQRTGRWTFGEPESHLGSDPK